MIKKYICFKLICLLFESSRNHCLIQDDLFNLGHERKRKKNSRAWNCHCQAIEIYHIYFFFEKKFGEKIISQILFEFPRVNISFYNNI